MEDEVASFKKELNALKEIALDQKLHFERCCHESDKRMVEAFLVILENLEPMEMLFEYLASKAALYDWDEDVPGNGYRTMLKLAILVVKGAKNLSHEIQAVRTSMFFRRESYLSKITSYSQGLKTIRVLLKLCENLISWSAHDSLFSHESSAMELIKTTDDPVNQYPFYSHLLGFQFCDSICTIFKALSILMASFSEMYYGNGITDIFKTGKYLLDPDVRSKRIVNISQYASALFCKHFWYLGEMEMYQFFAELMVRFPSLIATNLAINEEIVLEPNPLQIQNLNGDIIDVPVPTSHIGCKNLHLRLLSASKRFGPVGSSWYSGSKFPSRDLIFHCHGGGFISQSPRSHETYLRQWALEIDCPIVSLDYSLAPESPFPRAVQEAFFAYCWMLQNLSLLGSTGERIVLAGDSAGANINFSLLQQCREYGIRPPDGAFFAYVPVLIEFIPSPSRLLSLIDPLLPIGFLIGCIKAYACSPEVFQKSLENEYKLRPNKENTIYKTNEECPMNCNGNEDVPIILTNEKEKDSGIWSRLCATVSSTFSVFSTQNDDKSLEELLAELKKEEFMPCFEDQMKFDVPQDPLLSPLLANEDVLKDFPPIALLTTDMDPFLDDCVEFAKKLKKCGNKVQLDILPGLSHGFLNFAMVSKEASEGSKRCASIIKDLLQAELCSGEECTD
ncbi:hormone-sensitive lipase isoform X2 [Cimex lectularius]|uniref:Hormone-sensitive lipase n=1 Tax=Cimex lectularius TaxID=79782 RepID=A0A8I6S165_CIMLE|nr:hormone-sensitive lipase isoform X2 [Cimex lectularius]